MIVISENIVQALGWTIVHSIWMFTLLALLYKSVSIVLFSNKPTVKYILGLLALGSCVLLFLGTFYSIFQMENTSNITPLEASVLPSDTFESSKIIELNNSNAATNNNENFLSDLVSAHASMIVIFWLLGIILYAFQFCNSYFFLKNLSNVGVEKNNTWQNFVNDCQEQLGIKRSIQFLQSSITKQPLTFGFFKPIILMPIALVNQLTKEEVEAILWHELAHIRRNDYLINLLQSIAEVIFYYHPAVWWLSKQVRKNREELCDDEVVAVGKSPFTYAQALLKTQKFNLINQQKTNLTMNATSKNKNHFSQRIFRIMGQRNEATVKRNASRPVLLLMSFGFLSFILFTSMIISGTKVVSVSADKMNVLYIGVENPITVAVSEIGIEEVELSTSNKFTTITPLGNGKYNVFISKATAEFQKELTINIKGKDFEKQSTFRVKRVPYPVLHLVNAKGEIISPAGPISANLFKTINGMKSHIPYEFDAQCKIVQYEMTWVRKDADPVEAFNSNQETFMEHTKALRDKAIDKDVYYFDRIKCLCPGDTTPIKMASIVIRIRG